MRAGTNMSTAATRRKHKCRNITTQKQEYQEKTQDQKQQEQAREQEQIWEQEHREYIQEQEKQERRNIRDK